MKHSETIGKLAEALSKAQGEMDNAAKDKANPFFKSSYADLASVMAACREPLSKNGLAVVQAGGYFEGKNVLTTKLIHTSGEWISGELPIQPVKNDPQGLGSALTYLRRYSLSALVGIAPAEDDGEAAMGRGRNGQQQNAPKPNAGPKPVLTPPKPLSIVGGKPIPGTFIPYVGPVPDFRMTFGKYKGKMLREVDFQNLVTYFEEVRAKCEAKVDLSAEVTQFLKLCESYVYPEILSGEVSPEFEEAVANCGDPRDGIK